MAREKIQIPFDEFGNLITYQGYGVKVAEWKDSHEFEDTLKFVHVDQGRSALRIHCKRTDGTMVTLFGKNIDDVIKHSVCGRLKGRFEFVKRGSNYGVNALRFDDLEFKG